MAAKPKAQTPEPPAAQAAPPPPAPKKQPASQLPPEAARWNFLLELSFGISSILMLVMPILVGGVSFFSGAAPLAIFGRVCATIVALGILLSLFNWQFTSSVIDSARAPLPAAASASEETPKTE